jgi:hypothetical protein
MDRKNRNKGTHVRQNDRQLPYLDRETLDIIFENVYGADLEDIRNVELRDLVFVLKQMQDYNYRYRNEMIRRAYSLLCDFMEFEINSEGTTLWLALCLAIKELYGMRDSTLQAIMKKVTVRK